MLEFVILILLSRKLAKMAREKGHSGGWAAVGVIAWIVGELVGIALGLALDLGAGVYLTAFVGAACGAAVGFAIVVALPDRADKLSIDELEETFG
jgi:hypothetical protein